LPTLRATISMLAPFCASCFATWRPIPSDAPVSRTVLGEVSTRLGLLDDGRHGRCIPFP
jgi:hypothetical protein